MESSSLEVIIFSICFLWLEYQTWRSVSESLKDGLRARTARLPGLCLWEKVPKETDWNGARSSFHLWVSAKVAFFIFPFTSLWKCLRAASSGEICALSQKNYNSYPFLFSQGFSTQAIWFAFSGIYLPASCPPVLGVTTSLLFGPAACVLVSHTVDCVQNGRKLHRLTRKVFFCTPSSLFPNISNY